MAQKAVVKGDEAGTKAAAVTGAAMELSSGGVSQVVVDRSFAFTIRDADTGANLFLGVVGDPTA